MGKAMTAAEFRDTRLRWRLTQQEMADTLGVSRRSVINWEAGNRQPPEIVRKLVQLLDEERWPGH